MREATHLQNNESNFRNSNVQYDKQEQSVM